MTPEAKAFLDQFSRDRAVNKKYYHLVPEKQFDYRMVQTSKRKSDSPRESLIHQIYVTRNYIYSVQVGKQVWNNERLRLLVPSQIKTYKKDQLIAELEKTEQELKDLLSEEGFVKKRVRVVWAPEPVAAITSLWGLNSHEVLHQGWNLAVMDHLDIERFSEIRAMWG